MRDSPDIIVPAGCDHYRLGVTFSQFKRYLGILHTAGADTPSSVAETSRTGGVRFDDSNSLRKRRVAERRLLAALSNGDVPVDAAADSLAEETSYLDSEPYHVTSKKTVQPSKHSCGATPLFPGHMSCTPGDSVKVAYDKKGEPVYFVRGNGPRFPDDKASVPL